MKKETFDIYKFLQNRALSWSAISSFEYDPSVWYSRYILCEKQPESQEMLFGKKIADSLGTKNPLAPFALYPKIEQKLQVVFNKIPMIGFMDTYDPKTHNFREFKTSKTLWPAKKAQDHGQLKMYALMMYITHKVRPEDYTIHLDCIQTKSCGDFSVDFVKPYKMCTHQVKITMADILVFGAKIKKTVSDMNTYVLLQQNPF